MEVVRYAPEWRQSLVALLARVGTTQLTDEEFAWWFDRNPAGEGIVSLAVDESEVIGVAAMSFFKTRLEGVETRLAIPVNVATDARYRGRGVFSTLAGGERGGGGRIRVSAHGHLPERQVVPDLHPPAGLDRPAAPALVGSPAPRRRRRAVRARPAGRTRWDA